MDFLYSLIQDPFLVPSGFFHCRLTLRNEVLMTMVITFLNISWILSFIIIEQQTGYLNFILIPLLEYFEQTQIFGKPRACIWFGYVEEIISLSALEVSENHTPLHNHWTTNDLTITFEAYSNWNCFFKYILSILKFVNEEPVLCCIHAVADLVLYLPTSSVFVL